MGKNDASKVTFDTSAFKAVEHIAVGWRISLNPDVFNGLESILVRHVGSVAVMHQLGGIAEIKPYRRPGNPL